MRSIAPLPNQVRGSATPCGGRARWTPEVLEPLPGTYVLILRASRERCVQIGRFGALTVRRGVYLYVGSAFGLGGCLARVRHHLRASGPHHWHIDYLRPAALLTEVWYTYDPRPRERRWVRVLAGFPGAEIPMAGFGASDSRCASHLFRFDEAPSLTGFRGRIRRFDPCHHAIRRLVLRRASPLPRKRRRRKQNPGL